MAFGSGERRDGEPETPPSPRLPVVGLAVGVGILIGVGAAFLFGRLRPAEEPRAPAPVVAAREETRSVERQTAARRLAVFDGREADPLTPPAVVMEGFVVARDFGPPYGAIDSTVFDTADVRIRLAGVLPVGRREVCVDAAELRFACGLMGRAALQNFLGTRPIRCIERFQPRGRGRENEAVITADCRVDDVDLADHMIRAGFAFPAEQGETVNPALAEARSLGRGVWAGPYEMPTRDRGLEDMAATPVGGALSLAGDGERPTPPPMAIEPIRPPTAADATNRRDAAPAEPAKPRKPRQTEERRRPAPTAAPTTATGAVPALDRLAPNAKDPPQGGVIAGPILPPPPGLAEKLKDE